MSGNCKCNWEHPRCKALDRLGRCVALRDTSFPNRTDCPFYEKRAGFKPNAAKRTAVADALSGLKFSVKGTRVCGMCEHKETCYKLSDGCLVINQALHELGKNV